MYQDVHGSSHVLQVHCWLETSFHSQCIQGASCHHQHELPCVSLALDQLQMSRDLESRFNSLNRTYLLLCWEVEEVKPRTEMRVSSGENSNLHKINAVIPPLPPIFETTTCAALGTIELLSRSSLLESNRSSASIKKFLSSI